MKKLWLLVLTCLVILSMPHLTALQGIQLHRPQQAEVGPDYSGALSIYGLDQGEEGAERLEEAHQLGSITNNYPETIEVDLNVEVEFLEAIYEDGETPSQEAVWENIIIYLGEEELDFADQEEGDSQEQASSVDLEPGESLDLFINEDSALDYPPPGHSVLEHFLGVARFSFTGYCQEGGYLFNIEPSGDLRQQYFYEGEMDDYAVTFSEDNELEDVTIQVYSHHEREEEHKVGQPVVTGQDGTAVKELVNGTYYFTACHEDYEDDYQNAFVVEDDSKTVDFEMGEDMIGQEVYITFEELGLSKIAQKDFDSQVVEVDELDDEIKLTSVGEGETTVTFSHGNREASVHVTVDENGAITYEIDPHED